MREERFDTVLPTDPDKENVVGKKRRSSVGRWYGLFNELTDAVFLDFEESDEVAWKASACRTT